MEPIHDWFGLSYCSYLTIPRSVLQSMPVDWQEQFVGLLQQMETKCGEHDVSWPKTEVRIRNRRGRFEHDQLADYQRGRRNVFAESRRHP